MTTLTLNRIARAAILTKDRTMISLVRPARHHDVIRYMTLLGYTPAMIARSEQGFATDTGRFVGRAAALRIARKAGQLKTPPTHPGELFSEDVW